MIPQADILFLSNGHGEDEIAGLILDQLARTDEDRARIAAWPMVGNGERYTSRGITTFGPRNSLPSEGFGTVSLAAFLRDLRAGFVGTYLSQARFARRLSGSARVAIAIGDIVPLAAALISGLPTRFYSSAKSAHYGGTDGHNALERALMRRAERVLVRDARTARQLGINGVRAAFTGNPMMDGVAGADGTALRAPGRLTLALIPGTRADALANARLLLEATAASGQVHGLLTAAPGFDLCAFSNSLPDGWRDAETAGTLLELIHNSGATASVPVGQFGEALAACDMAIGMAGTGNEQAVGLGLPLIAVPGAGNQGIAFHRMKTRYFGAAAISVAPEAVAIAETVRTLADDPDRRAAMAKAGRALMGSPGASAAIAEEIRARAGWEISHV